MGAPSFATGPRGGDLESQPQAEARRAPLNDGDTGLHRKDGWTDTTHPGVKNEQSWHHMAAMLVADGRANVDIAEVAGVTPAYIGVLKAQRWFQERVAQLTLDRAKGLAARLAAEAEASLDVMIQMRDSSENERIRYAAAKDLLEQAHGKAVQKVYSVNTNISSKPPEQEMQDLLSELQSLRAAQPLPLNAPELRP